jgi:hypothetical protein
MPKAPIQDLVYQPGAVSPMKGVSDGHRNWNPWNGTTDESSAHDEGHQSSASGMFVRSMRTWDVKMPPKKKHMVGGHLVPNLIGKVQFMAQRTRRISIEIHGPAQSQLETTNDDCPIKQQTMMQGLLRGERPDSHMEKEFLNDKEAVFFRVLKEEKGSHRFGNDDSSTGSSAQGSHAGTYTNVLLSSLWALGIL